jgi:hypothetical protein
MMVLTFQSAFLPCRRVARLLSRATILSILKVLCGFVSSILAQFVGLWNRKYHNSLQSIQKESLILNLDPILKGYKARDPARYR